MRHTENDPFGADLIPFARAARQLPVPVHPSCVFRWARHGVVARDGTRVRLAHVRIGRRLFVRLTDVIAFGRSLAAADVAGFEAQARKDATPKT